MIEEQFDIFTYIYIQCRSDIFVKIVEFILLTTKLNALQDNPEIIPNKDDSFTTFMYKKHVFNEGTCFTENVACVWC